MLQVYWEGKFDYAGSSLSSQQDYQRSDEAEAALESLRTSQSSISPTFATGSTRYSIKGRPTLALVPISSNRMHGISRCSSPPDLSHRAVLRGIIPGAVTILRVKSSTASQGYARNHQSLHLVEPRAYRRHSMTMVGCCGVLSIWRIVTELASSRERN